MEQIHNIVERLQRQSTGRTSQIVCEDVIEKERAWFTALNKRGIGRRFWDSTFENIEGQQIPENVIPQYKKIKDYVEHIDQNVRKGIGMILKGPVGTMKTSFAVAVLQEYLKRENGSGFFVSMVSMLDDIFTMKERNKDEWLKYEDKIRNTGILIIDDLGTEYHQEWVLSKVDAIICYRYNHMKPVIVTTNLSNEDLKGRYTERIIDRLRSTSKVVTFTGDSLRQSVS